MTKSTWFRRLLALPAGLAIGGALVLAPPMQPAGATSTIEVSEVTHSGAGALLLEGDYAWRVSFWQPLPARMFGIPTALSDQVGARTVEATFYWGDGSHTTINSETTDPSGTGGRLYCNSGYVESGEPVSYTPQDGFGFDCWAEVEHRYSQQGDYIVDVTVQQETDQGLASGTSPSLHQLITDIDIGGSLSGRGTVDAAAGGGGMFDQNFLGGVATFQVTAKRRGGSTATTASVTVSVPSMRNGQGMTFTGNLPLVPLYIDPMRGGGEAFLTYVEGSVTSGGVYAGGAWATVHVLVKRGAPTLVRISIQNTSAGYTYLDTDPVDDFFYLDPATDRLRSGNIKLG